MSHYSQISIRSLQHPLKEDRGFFRQGENYYCNMNPAFYHFHDTSNVLGKFQSAYGTQSSGGSLERTTNTTAVHSWELQHLPNPDAQVLHGAPYSHHCLLEGIGVNSTSLAPSNGPNVELNDPPLPSFTPKSPEFPPILSTEAPTFLDNKAALLPRISSHVQEAVSLDGRRQWYCMFPHCMHNPFLRRDRAEIHVANIHLKEKSIYCNGSCGKAGW